VKTVHGACVIPLNVLLDLLVTRSFYRLAPGGQLQWNCCSLELSLRSPECKCLLACSAASHLLRPAGP
jgi:hypothetical protein